MHGSLNLKNMTIQCKEDKIMSYNFSAIEILGICKSRCEAAITKSVEDGCVVKGNPAR